MTIRPNSFDTQYPEDAKLPENRNTWGGDILRSIGSTVAADLGAVPALAGALIDAPSNHPLREMQRSMGTIQDTIDKSISPRRRAAMVSEPFPGKGTTSVLEHGFWDVAGMKTGRFVGSAIPLAASQVAGATVGGMVGGPPGALAGGILGTGLTGFTQGAGGHAQSVRMNIEKASDAQMMASPVYAAMRDAGHSVDDAKDAVIRRQEKDFTPAGIGGMASGIALGRIISTPRRGVASGAAHAALESSAGGALEGVGMEMSQQLGEKHTGFRTKYDYGEMARAAANSALEEAAFSTPIGAVRGIGNAPEVVPPLGPDAAQRAAITAGTAPPPSAPPPPPAGATPPPAAGTAPPAAGAGTPPAGAGGPMGQALAQIAARGPTPAGTAPAASPAATGGAPAGTPPVTPAGTTRAAPPIPTPTTVPTTPPPATSTAFGPGASTGMTPGATVSTPPVTPAPAGFGAGPLAGAVTPPAGTPAPVITTPAPTPAPTPRQRPVRTAPVVTPAPVVPKPTDAQIFEATEAMLIAQSQGLPVPANAEAVLIHPEVNNTAQYVQRVRDFLVKQGTLKPVGTAPTAAEANAAPTSGTARQVAGRLTPEVTRAVQTFYMATARGETVDPATETLARTASQIHLNAIKNDMIAKKWLTPEGTPAWLPTRCTRRRSSHVFWRRHPTRSLSRPSSRLPMRPRPTPRRATYATRPTGCPTSTPRT